MHKRDSRYYREGTAVDDRTISWEETLGTMVRTISPDVQGSVEAASRLKEDLHLHSLAIIELALGLEEVLELKEVDFEAMASVATVGDLASSLQTAVDGHKGVLPRRAALVAWVGGYTQ